MKIKAVFTILFAGILMFSGCKKEGNMGGKKSITGIIYFHDGVTTPDNVAPGATVFITYDSKIYTGNVDETTTTDSKGAYNITGLKKGDYFISAEYITSHGFKYTTQGHGVTIGVDVDKINYNIRLY